MTSGLKTNMFLIIYQASAKVFALKKIQAKHTSAKVIVILKALFQNIPNLKLNFGVRGVKTRSRM